MPQIKNVPIGEVLREYGYITKEQLDRALDMQKNDPQKRRLGQILIDEGFITERQKLEALAQRMSLELIDISTYPVDMDCVGKIPQRLAEKYRMIAVSQNGNQLVAVVDDPMNFYAQEDIRQLTGCELSLLLCESKPLTHAIEYYYSEIAAHLATSEANKAFAEVEELEIEEGEGDAPVIKLLSSLIQRGYSRNASDIHIEPFEEKTIVRMRIDGTLVEFVTLQKSVHASLIARIKIMSSLNIAEKRVPQDGHFRTKIDNEYINIRVSLIPTVFGEKAVLRLLAGNTRIDNSSYYGMTLENYEKFSAMLESPNGIVYLTGPTGSGKTTTLYMALGHMSEGSVNISTIEDPVEKNLPAVNQMQVNNTAGLTFESGLRALLRQDPDIIMVGETRDAETASISVRAAITGHLVFSTLHTNSAAGSIIRLRDMGLEPYMIANSLVGIVAQRLVRKCCSNCVKIEPPTPEERAFIGNDIAAVAHSHGCDRCNHTGYSGRVAIHEILMVDKKVRILISEGATTEQLEDYAIKTQGMKTLKVSATNLVKQGVTTVAELKKIAYYS
ncbi:MAG: GspE/PulE family protein [Eubacteriales bacterium]